MQAYLTEEIKATIRRLAVKYAPQEMCGIIYDKGDGDYAYLDVPNTHPDPIDYFRIDARVIGDLNSAKHAIMAIVHSHPRGSSDPSAYDKVQANLHSRPYVIVGMDGDIAVHEPERAPLVGRQYVHGTQDCYGIVRDYYARELGIIIPDKQRTDLWWQDKEAESLYVQNFKDFGFVEVDKSDLRKHDVLLCRWGDTYHVNHALIYLGAEGTLKSEVTEPCIGSRLCLHHLYNNLSGRIQLGESRLRTCDIVVRHKDLM